MGRREMRGLTWLAAAMFVACSEPPPPAPNVFGPRNVRQALASGQLGDDCLTVGAAGCRSGFCARLSGTRAICTHLCEPDGVTCDADAGWNCVPVSPEGGQFWCVPDMTDGGAP